MPWMMAAAVVGSSLLGSRTAKKAGETQAAAADRAAELQQQQFENSLQHISCRIAAQSIRFWPKKSDCELNVD